MNPYHKLLKNSAIITIANIGSKLLSFILVPFYSRMLTEGEFGIADALINSIPLIVSVITLYISDATIIFGKDRRYDIRRVLSNSIIISLGSGLLLFMLYPVLRIWMDGVQLLLILLCILATAIYHVLEQYARAIGRMKTYAGGGVLFSVVLFVATLVLLGPLQMRVQGFLLAYLLAYLAADIFYFFALPVAENFSFRLFDLPLLKQMLFYCVPLIPSVLMWWVIAMSDRYMIIWMIGAGAAGLYAMASKIPAILNLLSNIFFQAWRVSVIDEWKSEEKHTFYSRICRVYIFLLAVAVSLLMVVSKPIFAYLLDSCYYAAVSVIPFLLIAALFSAMEIFFGSMLTTAKDTRSVFISTIAGALVNIVFNLLLIPLLGINGAAIGTLLGHFSCMTARYATSRKYARIDLGVGQLVVDGLLLAGQTAIFLLFSGWWCVGLQAVVSIALVLLNRRQVGGLLAMAKGFITSKKTTTQE